VFCRGTQPIDAYGRWQIVAYQTPIRLQGADGWVNVQPNDWIFADADGVLVIPEQLASTVCQLAEERVRNEDLVRARLAETDDLQALYNEIGRW
jgi:4-hydroxy-4-methyl-2-oxoglutarate aldolase